MKITSLLGSKLSHAFHFSKRKNQWLSDGSESLHTSQPHLCSLLLSLCLSYTDLCAVHCAKYQLFPLKDNSHLDVCMAHSLISFRSLLNAILPEKPFLDFLYKIVYSTIPGITSPFILPEFSHNTDHHRHLSSPPPPVFLCVSSSCLV